MKKVPVLQLKKFLHLQVKKVPNLPAKKAPPYFLKDCEECEKSFRSEKSCKSHVETAHDQPGASLLSRSQFFSGGLLDYGHSSVTIVVKKLANKLAIFLCFLCYICGKNSCKEISENLNRIALLFYLSVKVYS